MSSPTLDVLCFGEALVDFFPERPGVPLSAVETFHRHLGGAPANVAVGLARLGLRSGLVTLVGADEFGRFVRERLADEGVNTDGVGTTAQARTGVTFVSVGLEGERSFTFYRHPSADMLVSPEHVSRALTARARVFHFGSSTLAREPSRSATLAALADAKEAGCLISCDPNFRPHLWQDVAEAPALINQTLADCNVVKVSGDETAALFGVGSPEEIARRLRELGVELAIVSLGAKGAYFLGTAGDGFVPAVAIDVIDTTGAGDGFVAGLWAALLPALAARTLAECDREALVRACVQANRVAGLVCTKMGATDGLPRER